MKKIILATMIASSMVSSVAMADMYVGVEHGAAQNTNKFTSNYYDESLTYDNNYHDVKLKLGGGADGGVKLQGTLSLISYNSPIFDDTNKNLMEFGFDVIKEFEVTPSFYPFLKIGLGVGSMAVSGYTKDSITAVSANLGAGVSYKVVDNFYLIAGVDYIARKWQDIEEERYESRVIDLNGLGTRREYYTVTDTVSTVDVGVKPYIGMNFQF